MKSLILFDVCDTLVDTNSTTEYITFLNKNKFGNKKYYILWNNIMLNKIYNLIKKISGYDIRRKLTFKIFKGQNLGIEKSLNREFFNLYLSKKKNLLDKLIEYKKDKNNDIYLVSASINQPIDLLGDYLGIKGFSTKLKIENNKYTGKAYYDLLGNKEYIFKNKMIDLSKYGKCLFYTDNISDFGFIKFLSENLKDIKVYPQINSNTKNNMIIWKDFLNHNNINYELAN